MQPPFIDPFFATFAFILGASIGSFLNVCIYRMPLNLSVNNPRRSFCPSCNYQIPWWNNLPLISWLSLRGKCANCGGKIAFRYFGVELLTGLLFLAVWLKVWPQEWILALPDWILVGLLVVATFIDFEHFIIPDEITWGGAVAGIILSLAIPFLQGQESHFWGFAWSVVGAAVGYGLLWAVVELGKKAFGKKAFRPEQPTEFSWIRRPVETPEGKVSDADLIVGDVKWKDLPPPSLAQRLGELQETILRTLKLSKKTAPQRGESWVWSDTFYRESDQLVMKCTEVDVDGEKFTDATLKFGLEEMRSGDRSWTLEKVDIIRGRVSMLVVPREAMGYGDVKFMACIGAFLGWKGVLFTVMAGSVVGAIVGVLTIVAGRRDWSARIPFGPYLAMGALLWLFVGQEIVHWYWQFAAGPR